MNKLQGFAALTAAVSLFAAQTTTAQVSEDGMGKILPVELFVCDFKEGKNQTNLDTAVAAWTAYMDERNLNDYSAWLLYPYFYGVKQDFDVIWMGAAPDGKAMFGGAHTYITEGGDVADGFNDVLECRAHVAMGSAMYQMPPGNQTPTTAIMTMSDCKMNEGTRYSDVRSAELEWAAYREEKGSKAGMWHWFPAYGGGDADFDYKIVYAYPDFNEVGVDWEMIANEGGRAKSMSIFNDMDECDDERVYIARPVRSAQLR